MVEPTDEDVLRQGRVDLLVYPAVLTTAAGVAVLVERFAYRPLRQAPRLTLLISAIGMTFVILTGGIDLSVSGVVALTTVASAVLLREGMNPWLVIALMLLMGMSLGAIMGGFIVKLKVQPFIATLAGMWFARGMCFFISLDAITISDPPGRSARWIEASMARGCSK